MMIDASDNIWFFFSSLPDSLLPSLFLFPFNSPLLPHFHFPCLSSVHPPLSHTLLSLTVLWYKDFLLKYFLKIHVCLLLCYISPCLFHIRTGMWLVFHLKSPGPYYRPTLLRFAIFTQILNYIIVHVLHSRSWHCYKMTAITSLWGDIHAAVLNLHFTFLEWG